MTVIPVQNKYEVIKLDHRNFPKTCTEIGNKIDKKYFHWETRATSFNDVMCIQINNNSIEIECDNYIVIYNRKPIAYLTEDEFKEQYIEVVNDEQQQSDS